MLDDLPFLRRADARGAMLAALETRLAPADLMEAAQLTFGFRGLGLAEAEVLELLLRTSPELQALTVHSGAATRTAAEWHLCVAALARGVGASRVLRTLNLRTFALDGEAGAHLAAQLAGHASLTALRLASNRLEAAALCAMVAGNHSLRVLAVQENPMPHA